MSVTEDNDDVRNFVSGVLYGLPQDVSLIVLEYANDSNPASTAAFLRREYSKLCQSGRIHFLKIPLGTFEQSGNWVRDYVPEVVFGADGPRLVRFRYSRAAEPAAQKIAKALSAFLNLPLVESDLRIDGGNLETDGEGHLFLTVQILKANPQLSQAQIEDELKRMLGVHHIHWLPVVPNEITGHGDMAVKYVGQKTFVVAASRQNHRQTVLNSIAAQLQGLGCNVIRVTNADAVYVPQDSRDIFPYANTMIINGSAFVPFYHSPSDMMDNSKRRFFDLRAHEKFTQMGFQSLGLFSEVFIARQGAVHCLLKGIPLAACW